MGKDDVRRSLKAIDDDSVRARVAEGDFDDLGDVDLTEDEAAMMRAAAAGYPDVAGYSFGTFQVGVFEDPVRSAAKKKKTKKKATKQGAYDAAVEYTL